MQWWIPAGLAGVKGVKRLNKDRLNIIFTETIKWCLYSIVFAAPFSKSISEIGITIAIAAWATQKILNKDLNFAKIALGIALSVYVITIIPSFFNTAYPELSIKAFFTKVLKYVFLCIIISDVVTTRERLRDLFIVAFLSIVVITVDGIIQYYTSFDALHGYRSFKMRLPEIPSGLFWDFPSDSNAGGFFKGFPTASFPFPNDLSAWILLVLLPLSCVAIFGMKKNGYRYLTGATSIALFYLFLLAKVRSAWLALGISMGYIAISKRKIWIVLLIIIVFAGSVLIKTEMTNNIFSTGSFGDRVGMLGTSWQIFMNHPIIGNGLNTFFVNFMKYRNDQWKDKKGSYAHNCYLQMAADTGIIGLAGFMFLIGAYFRVVICALRNIKDNFYRTALWGISIGVFAFLAHSLFDTNLYSLNLATLFWFYVGTSLAIINAAKTTGL